MLVQLDRGRVAQVATLEEAGRAVRAHLDRTRRRSSEWYAAVGPLGAAVVGDYLETVLARGSYNGRLWVDGKPLDGMTSAEWVARGDVRRT